MVRVCPPRRPGWPEDALIKSERAKSRFLDSAELRLTGQFCYARNDRFGLDQSFPNLQRPSILLTRSRKTFTSPSESAEYGGVGSLAHFLRRGPFVEFGEQGGLDLFDFLR